MHTGSADLHNLLHNALRNGVPLAYDVNNHLTQLGTTFAAGYTGAGLRAWRTADGVTTHYLYDGTLPVCEYQLVDDAPTLSAVNTFGPTGLLARNESGGLERWYQFDAEGNVAERLDAQGAVLSADVYDAYGLLLAGGDVTDPFGYKGQVGYYTDHATGLILCTFRYYDPALGRWLTEDPIGYAGGVNVYGYCGGEPVGGVDPLGLATHLVLWTPYDGKQHAENRQSAVNRVNYLRRTVPPGDIVRVAKIRNYNEYQSALTSNKDIVQMDLLAHCDPITGTILLDIEDNVSTNMTADTLFDKRGTLKSFSVYQLNNENVVPGATITLFCCSAGNEFERDSQKFNIPNRIKSTNIGRAFSDHFKANVYATKGPVHKMNLKPDIPWDLYKYTNGSGR